MYIGGIQVRNPEFIVLIRSGIFFMALDESALALNDIFALKPICLKEGVCKSVIPVSEIKRYMDAMIYLKFSFVLYDYDKNKIGDDKLKPLFKYKGEENLNDREYKQDCDKCWYKDKKVINFEKEFRKFMEGYDYGKGK